MKRRLLIGTALVVILTLAGMFLPRAEVSIAPSGGIHLAAVTKVAYAMSGSGTEGDPYIIADVDDLQAVENNLSAWYELGNNIDASATSGWNGGAGFVPITAFTGHFDGKGYVISGMTINQPAVDLLGLFVLNTGTIQYVGMENATINADEKSGILVGKNDSGGVIRHCYVTGTVTGAGSKGKSDGGLVGDNKATVNNCYSTASVNGLEKAGGFVGKQEGGTIDNCYSTGAVTNGFGFTGETKGAPINNSFWDTETSGQTGTDPGGAIGKTTAEMKTQSTFTDAGWDFTNVWEDEDAIHFYRCRLGLY